MSTANQNIADSATLVESVDIGSPSLVFATSPSDYIQLLKLRMGLLAALIAATGYYMASPGAVNLVGMLHAFIGTLFVSAGAFALNMYLERDLDGLMERTRTRPLPAQRMHPNNALVSGIILSVIGVLYLGVMNNMVAAAVGAIALASYVGVYTPMKRVSNFNTIVGAIPGALPPVIGWAAVQGEIGFGAGLMFAILFLWQLPHFLAIAWMYKEDYMKAGMPMITTLDGDGRFTARQMVIYGAAYVFMTLLPSSANMAGQAYLWTALVSGIAVFALCVRWAFRRDYEGAVHVFLVSLVHLPLLYLMMVVDKTS